MLNYFLKIQSDQGRDRDRERQRILCPTGSIQSQMPAAAGTGLDQSQETGTSLRSPMCVARTQVLEVSSAASQDARWQEVACEAEEPGLNSI